MLLASFKSISVALLTSVTMLCITPAEHIHIITGSLSLLTTFTISPTPHPLPLVATNLSLFLWKIGAITLNFFYFLPGRAGGLKSSIFCNEMQQKGVMWEEKPISKICMLSPLGFC